MTYTGGEVRLFAGVTRRQLQTWVPRFWPGLERHGGRPTKWGARETMEARVAGELRHKGFTMEAIAGALRVVRRARVADGQFLIGRVGEQKLLAVDRGEVVALVRRNLASPAANVWLAVDRGEVVALVAEARRGAYVVEIIEPPGGEFGREVSRGAGA